MAMAEGTDNELSFRPSSYWEPDTSYKEILANIKGADRKKWVKEAIEGGRMSDIEEWMLMEKLSDSDRIAIGKIHPRYMGGEYLPDLEQSEVEIARVTLQSVTQDVISIRATAASNRIDYRIVDEYETDWRISPASSLEPLSMGEMIEMLDSARTPDEEDVTGKAGPVWGALTMNLDGDDNPMGLIGFVEVTSEFYPGLNVYYAREIEDFLREFGTRPK
jgi:hypothetical protein